MKDILIKALFAGAIAMLAGQSAHAAGQFAG